MRTLALALAASVWVGCTCADTGASKLRFACKVSDDCSPGFFCAPSGECEQTGSGGGGGGAATGGGAGGAGGGATVDAGTLRFVFTSPPPNVILGSCSAPIDFEVREGNALAPVAAATPVNFAAAPGGALGLFSGPGCTGAPPFSLAPDASSGSLSFQAGDAGTFTLTLSAPGYLSATQQATVSYAPVRSAVFVTSEQTVRAGDCSAAVTIELRDAANQPTRASGPLVIALSATPTPGVLFHTDSACALAPVTQVTVPAGATRATVYVDRVTGQPYTLTATVGDAGTTLPHTVLPVVRSGSCVVGAGDGGTTCAFSPSLLSLADSFLVYQVSSASAVSGAVAVECELAAVDSLTCRRGQTDGDALINWQVAEVKGATVRKVASSCDGGSTSVTIGSPAPLGSSFVLTASENDGNTIDESDFGVARLNAAGTAVDFSFGGPCTGSQSMVAQVVTLPSIVVARALTSLLSGSTSRSLQDPPSPQQGVLLAQWRLPTGSGPGICDRAIRTELAGNNLNFFRSNTSPSATCSAANISNLFYERVDFRSTATVQQAAVTMAIGATTASAALSSVDRTRTLVFTGGQGSMGQSLGEGTLPGTTTTSDFLGDVSAGLSLGGTAVQSTQVTARRSSAVGASRWTVWVVELIP